MDPRGRPGAPVRRGFLRRPSSAPIGAVVGLVVLVAIPGAVVAADAAHRAAHPALHPKIQHVVVIFKENHSYDNLYGTYCLKSGKYCPTTGNGLPNGTCVPIDPSDPSSVCHVPQALTKYQLVGGNLPHQWINSYDSWNNGSMNGFWAAEGKRNLTFGHYNGSTVPFYWDLAEQYAVGDDFFSSAMSYSMPNHWFMLASATPASMAYSYGDFAHNHLHSYLNQANVTSTVQDLLLKHPGVSWDYYDWNLSTYQYAINQFKGGPQSAYDLWNPLAGRAESYNASFASHFLNRSQFLVDAANGALPNVSWIIPSYASSDHPGQSLATGEAWTAAVIDAVESSPEWNSTAIFLTWDEYGGWYDHVAPTVLNRLNYGFRVPLIVISPYTPENRVVHQSGTFDSILRYVETQFSLGCLGGLDCNATALGSFFNLSMAPRPPMLFPTDPTLSHYPMALQNLSAMAPVGGTDRSDWAALIAGGSGPDPDVD